MHSVTVHRTALSGIPTPTLAEALIQHRKNATQLLSFGPIKRAAPERRPNNALFLEGVLGYDEEMLSDILRPLMKGLVFALTWTVRPSLPPLTHFMTLTASIT